MEIYQVHKENPSIRFIKKAVDELKKGNLIIYPTDVNYGLACSLNSSKGVKALNILAEKQGRNKLHTVICKDFADISNYAYMSNICFKKIKILLPGAYTIILEAKNTVPKICQTKRKTIGIRIINTPSVNSILEELDSPLLNITALPDKEDCFVESSDDLLKLYNGNIGTMIDVGEIVSEKTTIMDFSQGDEPVILR